MQQKLGIYGSEHCDSRTRAAFCSTITSVDDAVCFAYPGTPISCTPGFIDGILISDQECITHGDQFMLKFISLRDHADWIHAVSASKQQKVLQILFVLSAFISFQLFDLTSA